MALGETARLLASLDLKDGLTPVVKTMTGSLDKMDTRIGKSSSRAYKAGQQIGTGIKSGVTIAAGAIASIGALLLVSAKEGQEALDVQLKYANAIKNSGKVSAQQVAALNAQQDALLKLTGADDEAIKAAQTRLITMGLTGDQILKLTPLISDLATATGKDLDTATLAVGKSALGSSGALGKMGVILPKVGKAAKSAALQQLELQRAQVEAALLDRKAAGQTIKSSRSATLSTLENQKAQLLATKAHQAAIAPLTAFQKAQYATKEATVNAALAAQRAREGTKKAAPDALAQRKAVLDAAIAHQKLADAQVKGQKTASSFDTTVKALNDRFKGTDEALSNTLPVRLKVLDQSLANIREEAGIKLLPAMTKIVDVVGSKLVPAFGSLIDSVLPLAIAGLDHLTEFLDSGGGVAAIDSLVGTMKTAAPILADAANKTFDVVKAAASAFAALPPEIQALAVAGLTINKLTGGLVTNIAGGLISAVISSFKGLMNVNAAIVNVNGGVGGVGGAGGAVAAAAGIGTAAALGWIGASVAATVVGSAAVRGAVDSAIANADVASLTAQAEAARKHGVSDANNAALKALQAIVHNTASLASPTSGSSAAQDAAENALMGKRSAFTSNPTRHELRVKIRDLEKLKPTKDTARAITSLQNRLQNRIDEEKKRIAAAVDASARGIIAAVRAAGAQPVYVTVPVTTNINGRVIDANLNRYQTITGDPLSRG